MGLLYTLKSLVVAPYRPRVGDAVWWAPMSLGCHITEIQKGHVIFQGGDLVTNSQGRVVPRWTVMTRPSEMTFDANLGMWVVGEGPMPKVVRGQVIRPEPVALAAKTGSFAVKESHNG